jgi:hypothetical protein
MTVNTYMQMALFCWTLLGHMGRVSYLPSWRLKLLRFMTQINNQCLVVIITTCLAAPWNVTDQTEWMDTKLMVCIQSRPALATVAFSATHDFSALQAFGTGHLSCLIVGVILLAFFWAFSLSSSLMLVNRVLDLTGKKNLLGASHGTNALFERSCPPLLG